MLKKAMMVGVAVLAAAVPAVAQQRGTVEFGVFGSNTSFDNGLAMRSGWGGGGRVGVFLTPWLAAEFEAGGSTAGRMFGLQNVSVGVLSARLAATPLKFGKLSMLVGAGVDHTDTYLMESYGIHGLLGAKYALTETVALRFDAIESYMPNGNFGNLGFHVGLSIQRNPLGRTVTRSVAGPAMVQRPDSVSASETRRLRGVAVNYRELRDSLGRPKPVAAFVIRDTVVLEGINFEYDSASFTPDSRDVLDRVAKAMIGSQWLNTSWEIAGHTSGVGSREYNMALSQRRAEAVRTYLVSRGVSDKRLFAKGYGEVNPRYPNDTEGRNWENRRVELRRIQGVK